MPADTSGTGCLSRGHPRLTFPSRHYRNIPKSSPALRRRGHDRLGRYAGYAEAVLFFDDQQAEAGQLCRWRLNSRLSSQTSSGPLYLVFTDTTRQRGYPAGVLRQHGAAGPPAQPHGRGVRRDGPGHPQSAGMAGNSPVYGPGWEFPLVVAQGVAGKPGLFLPGRTVYFCPFQPGVQQDDALRLRQGLGERAGGQESGPAGGAAGPCRLLPGKYPSRGSQRGQERPRRSSRTRWMRGCRMCTSRGCRRRAP